MNWYAVYTKPRFEKKVAAEFERKGINHYLPLVKILKQWSDRKKWIQQPLFSSYVFVEIEDEDYMDVLQTDGVVKFVTFEKRRISIPSRQIEAVRNYVESGDYMDERAENFEVGGKVEIVSGSLKGIEGRLLKQYSKHKVRIEIEGIHQFIYLNIPLSHLKPVKT